MLETRTDKSNRDKLPFLVPTCTVENDVITQYYESRGSVRKLVPCGMLFGVYIYSAWKGTEYEPRIKSDRGGH
jgi:hypothetical protein